MPFLPLNRQHQSTVAGNYDKMLKYNDNIHIPNLFCLVIAFTLSPSFSFGNKFTAKNF